MCYCLELLISKYLLFIQNILCHVLPRSKTLSIEYCKQDRLNITRNRISDILYTKMTKTDKDSLLIRLCFYPSLIPKCSNNIPFQLNTPPTSSLSHLHTAVSTTSPYFIYININMRVSFQLLYSSSAIVAELADRAWL